jgi:hypothetical protein
MDITISQIGAFLGLIAGIISSVSIIGIFINKNFKKMLKNELDPMSKQMDIIKNNINDLDISQCKNFLVRFLADIEQGNPIDEVERERAYEIYDRYTNQLKQNSYIHKRWHELMEKEK